MWCPAAIPARPDGCERNQSAGVTHLIATQEVFVERARFGLVLCRFLRVDSLRAGMPDIDSGVLEWCASAACIAVNGEIQCERNTVGSLRVGCCNCVRPYVGSLRSSGVAIDPIWTFCG